MGLQNEIEKRIFRLYNCPEHFSSTSQPVVMNCVNLLPGGKNCSSEQTRSPFISNYSLSAVNDMMGRDFLSSLLYTRGFAVQVPVYIRVHVSSVRFHTLNLFIIFPCLSACHKHTHGMTAAATHWYGKYWHTWAHLQTWLVLIDWSEKCCADSK